VSIDFTQLTILGALLFAFGGGVLSFASPCVLPLVPAYIGHLAGHTIDKEGASRARTLMHAAAFVAGFTIIFVLLGSAASYIGERAYDVLRSTPFRVFSGVVLIVLGLHMTGLLRITALYRDTRFHFKANARLGLLSSLIIGVIFAAGWTPCIGPILGGILLLAAQQGTVSQGALLLTAYSLGLGVPFLVAGYALESSTRLIQKLNRHVHTVELISGSLMILMGILVVFNFLSIIASWATNMGFVIG
jgi:cytochrome c-type biogenesis protein